MKKMILITIILLISNGIVGFFQLELPAVTELKEMEKSLDQKIFPKEEVIEVKLEIDEADFQDMLENPMEEEYKTATIDYNGYRMENIAVRTKGNSSLSSVAQMESDRYSFKVNFDYYIEGQSLLGLSVINLNNNFSDATYMREFLTYQLLEEMGVPVPKTSYVNLFINGELKGLYLAVEEINEPFLRRYYEDTSGDLYKPEGNGSDLIWKGEELENYSGMVLKTNEKSSDHGALFTMLKALDEGTDVEKYINVDSFLRYLAVSTALVNLDSYQGSLKHNYYLYEEQGYFHFLPWDFNMSFAGFSRGGQSIGLKIDEPTEGDMEERPLIDKLLAVAEYKETYHQYMEEIVNGFMDKAQFRTIVNELAALLRPHVENDPTKFYTLEEFEKAIFDEESGLIAFTETRAENIKQQLSGEISLVKDGTETTGQGNWGGQGGFPGGQRSAGLEGGMKKEMRPQGEAPPEFQGGMPEGEGQTRQRPDNQGMRGGPGGAGPLGANRETQENTATPLGARTVVLIGVLIAFIAVLFFPKGRLRWN